MEGDEQGRGNEGRRQDDGYTTCMVFPHCAWVETKEGNRLDLPTFSTERAADHSYECYVEARATRRLPARLIAFPVPEEVTIKHQADNWSLAQRHSRQVNPTLQDLAHRTGLFTNVPADLLSAHEALIQIPARWQIELL
jgi:hypothetical protein